VEDQEMMKLLKMHMMGAQITGGLNGSHSEEGNKKLPH